MKLIKIVLRISLFLCSLTLINDVHIHATSPKQDSEIINQVLSTIFPRLVTAQELGYAPIHEIKGISLSTSKAFDDHMRILVNESCNVIQECWEIVKDFISEGSDKKIHHYIPQLEALEQKIHTLVLKNQAFLKAQDNTIHEAHRQILDVIQTLIVDLVHITNTTKQTIANKKEYLIKKGKPSAAKLCGKLLNRLDPYIQRVDTYLDKIQYMWDLTVKAGHSTIVNPLQDLSETIIDEYSRDPKSFSEEKIGAAVQHKFK